jgi:ribosomal protein S18 acetylase RimI-like enzyme
MDPDIEIVETSLDDALGFQKCLSVVAKEGEFLAMTEAPPVESVAEYIAEAIKCGYPHFMAKLGGEIIGWSDIIPRRHETLRHCGTLGIGVEEGYRRRGIGRRLAQAAIGKAHDMGLERLELEVFARNKQAISFYKMLGFKVEGTKRKAKKYKNSYDDIIFMGLLLTE